MNGKGRVIQVINADNFARFAEAHKLAKEGKKILLVEQHDRPGGCATTFKRNDFVFEVGSNVLCNPHHGTTCKKSIKCLL